MTDPWGPPAPRRPDRPAANRRAGWQEPETAGGFESASQRRRRVLRTRNAETWLTRGLRQLTGVFRADEYPRLLAEAAYGAQSAVTTGRRIAVVGSRGGAGKTTTAALLARVYAAMRQDAVAAVDAGTGPGTLGLRLGRTDIPSVDRVVRQLEGRMPASFEELSDQLAAVEPNLLAAGSRSGANGLSGAAQEEQPALDAVARAVSRYCPITIFDCGTGMEHPSTDWALGNSHLGLFVAPASVSGLDDAQRYAQAWSHDSRRGGVPLVLLLVQTDADAPFNPAAEAARLRRDGHTVAHLGYDRHLAGGVELDLALLARSTRLEATSLASQVLAGSIAEGRSVGEAPSSGESQFIGEGRA
jgi:MinD-like ATPase involved in chromosome partitioning or flagellar assembly